MQPQQPGYYPPQQPPQSTAAQKVTAWSAGMIALVIVGPIVAVILCCVGCFVFGGLGTIFGGGNEPAPEPVTVTTPAEPSSTP